MGAISGEEMAGMVSSLGKFDKVLVPGVLKQGMHDAGGRSADLWKVPVGNLKVMPGFNVRIRDAEHAAYIRELAESIKANGFLPHSVLAGYVANEGGSNVVYVTDGHCRLEAVELANAEGSQIEDLPIVISAKGTSKEDLTACLITKNSGKKLTTFERAIVVKRLTDYGWDRAKIAARTRVSTQEADNLLLLLLSAPSEVREMVASGEVAAGVAVAEMRRKGDGAVASLNQMKQVAKAKGHGQVTARHQEGAGVRKVIRKEGENMLNAIRQLREEPAFSMVSSELKELVEQVLARFEKQDKKDQKDRQAEKKVSSTSPDKNMSPEAKALASF